VKAWSVTEGDVFPDGATVVSVQRDPTVGQVTMRTNDGARRVLRRDDGIVLAYRARAVNATPPRPMPGGILGRGARRRPW